MHDQSRGGNDVVIGGDSAILNSGCGDGCSMFDDTVGGNDLLIGGVAALENNFRGDGMNMAGHAQGGNDLVIGGDDAVINILHGDGITMRDYAVGGNDVVIAGNDAGNTLYGDAATMLDFTVSGNDTLISGNAADNMWGDSGTITANVTTGTDIFVFKPGNNADQVNDFRQSDHDQIELSAFAFDDIGDLNISVASGNTVIDFGGGNSVTLVGFTDPLTASDFIF